MGLTVMQHSVRFSKQKSEPKHSKSLGNLKKPNNNFSTLILRNLSSKVANLFTIEKYRIFCCEKGLEKGFLEILKYLLLCSLELVYLFRK